VQNTLDIWPELPLVISSHRGMSKPQDADNIIAALKEHDRVRQIDMHDMPNSFLQIMQTMEMSNPFSTLTSLLLISRKIDAPVLPDSFLGGSTPRLQTLSLDGVPFPALPNLLSSTHDLIELQLWNIPLSGHISPEAMVTCLAASTGLKDLRIGFRSPRSWADRGNRLVPHLTRVVLPALTSLCFKGNSKYFEDIVAQIDTPLLTQFNTTFFNQLIFDTPLLSHFISRTETFKASHLARVTFKEGGVNIRLFLRNGNGLHEISSLAIVCKPSDWQLSSLAQVCDSALSPLPTLENLEIYISRSWKHDVENAQWLDLLNPFTSIKDLLLYDESILHVASALEQLAEERETEALPTLRHLFLRGAQPSGPVKKAIGKFVAVRQLSDRPVSVYHRIDELYTWQQVHWEAGDG
jgi:hypothetical protein